MFLPISYRRQPCQKCQPTFILKCDPVSDCDCCIRQVAEALLQVYRQGVTLGEGGGEACLEKSAVAETGETGCNGLPPPDKMSTGFQSQVAAG